MTAYIKYSECATKHARQVICELRVTLGLGTSPPDLNSCGDLENNYDQTLQWLALSLEQWGNHCNPFFILVLFRSSFLSVMSQRVTVIFLAFALTEQ